jgi:CheY-like chemotaxis protein
LKRPIKVLLVDDRKVVRLTLKEILLGFDCVFSEAPDGVTALTLMVATRFDVIFLDLKLPDLSGIAILREGRRQGIVLGKVIILTGLPDPETHREAALLGAFKYLTKQPMGWEEIRNAFVEAISDSTHPVPENKQARRFLRQ